MPGTLGWGGERWGGRIHEEIPVAEAGERWQKSAAMTQQIARVFEQGIREHPADWHMLQRVFVSDLDPQRLATARARAVARARTARKNGAEPGPAASGDPAAADTVAGGP